MIDAIICRKRTGWGGTLVALPFLVIALGCTAAGGAPPGAPTPHAEVAATPATPLGSSQNPVLAGGVFGEREFLMRLRCPNGTAVAFVRIGSFGSRPDSTGPRQGDAHMLDGYRITCPDREGGTHESTIYLDMYHAGHRERGPLPPYTVLPELPARTATGCPPRVYDDSVRSAAHVFNYLEVEHPVTVLNPPPTPIMVGVSRVVRVSFVVDTAGRIEMSTLRWDPANRPTDPPAMRVDSLMAGLIFTPALHHAGCRVRQGHGMVLEFR